MPNRLIRDRSSHRHGTTPSSRRGSAEPLPHLAWPAFDHQHRLSIDGRLARYQQVQDWLTRMVGNGRLSEEIFRESVLRDEDDWWDLQDSTHHDHSRQKFLPPTLGWMLENPGLFARIEMDHTAFLRYMLMKRRQEYWETWFRLAEQMMVNPRVMNILPVERRWKFFEEFAVEFYTSLWRLQWKLLEVDPEKLRNLWWRMLREAPNVRPYEHGQQPYPFEGIPGYLWWGGDRPHLWDLFQDDAELLRFLRLSIEKGVEDPVERRNRLARYFVDHRHPEIIDETIAEVARLHKVRYPSWTPQPRESMLHWPEVREGAMNRALPLTAALLAA